MRKLFVVLLIALLGCDELVDIKKIDGPCTIQLKDGTLIETEGIELLKSTGTLTYRDQDGKLWSIAVDRYERYTCGN
ncbi:hypothetical protein [Algoriphagus confluentis]|uniref:DUF903 domain-containing protein n=1 Tax=Algoriphagus confluentis TaxID=1697556 RepID=A0ABQ6PQV5_9BACT|nr:hypothetical protein Aconfl_29540 [Algoriphagus confluentis]